MMSQELKDKWLTALRSGEYKPGAGTLRDGDDCYCCLGVLADICEAPGYKWQGFDSLVHNSWLFGTSPSDSFSGFLPEELAVDLLVTPGQGEDVPDHIVAQNFMDKVADMNDSGQYFTEIADWLEENLHV